MLLPPPPVDNLSLLLDSDAVVEYNNSDMKQKKQYDHIDEELSRLFFKNETAAEKTVTLPNPEQKKSPVPPDKSEAKKEPPKMSAAEPKAKKNFLPVIIVAVIVVIICSSAFFVFGKKQILFTVVDVNTGQQFKQSFSFAKNEKVFSDQINLSGLSEHTLYDFELTDNGWEIPLWERTKPDHVAHELEWVNYPSSKGNGSICLTAGFRTGRWTGALIEIAQYIDLSVYTGIATDIYLPPAAPKGLKAKFIFTVKDDWSFVEMSKGIPLAPGKWTVVYAGLEDTSRDWKRTKVDNDFRADVRKMAIRIEANNGPAYSGPIYIDNIRVFERDRSAK
ncbi:MAG TPA: hypothetical protein PKG81_07020 [Candidatus Omnitrophota bacterium]|nr:hypothetical protein [Candidatus Omnitrophota bacterium]